MPKIVIVLNQEEVEAVNRVAVSFDCDTVEEVAEMLIKQALNEPRSNQE